MIFIDNSKFKKCGVFILDEDFLLSEFVFVSKLDENFGSG